MHDVYLHTALFRWKAGAPVSGLEACLDQIASCRALVPGIRRIAWGLNQSKWSQGFTHVLHVEADDAAALAAYRGHDVRQRANKLIVEWEDGVVSADFVANGQGGECVGPRA